MSGLLDEVRQAAVDPRLKCGVRDFIATLDEDDQRDVAIALADPNVPVAAIHAVLARRGLPMQPDAVRRHRRGECRCGRTR